MNDVFSFVRLVMALAGMAGTYFFMSAQYDFADKMVHGRHVQRSSSYSTTAASPRKTEPIKVTASRDELAAAAAGCIMRHFKHLPQQFVQEYAQLVTDRRLDGPGDYSSRRHEAERIFFEELDGFNDAYRKEARFEFDRLGGTDNAIFDCAKRNVRRTRAG